MRHAALLAAVACTPFMGCATVRESPAAPDTGATCVQSQRVGTIDDQWLMADCYPGKEPAIVFIHGWSQSRVVWAEQVAAFAGSRALISYDLRGHGESTRPRDASSFRGDWTPARDLEAVLDRFDVEQAVLVGWSFGSIVAANSAVFLGSGRIRGIVLVSGTVESGTERNLENFGPLMAELAPLTKPAPIDREVAAVHQFLSESYRFGEWPRALYEQVFEANMRLTPAERSIVAERPRQVFAGDLNRLGISILLVHGAEDPVFSVESSRQAHAELDNSRLTIYEDTGHWPFIEQASRFNADLSSFIEGKGMSK